MILSIGKCRCRIDAVFLLLPLLARRFGMNREALALLLSLAAHESGHLIAAKIARANVSELRFTPFGALATIEKLYEPPPGASPPSPPQGRRPISRRYCCCAPRAR